MDIKHITSQPGKGITDKPDTTSVDARLGNPQQARAADNRSGRQAVEVQLSATAEVARKALADLDKTPDVRQDKVESLKAAIADGSYRVDAERLATTLLDIDNQLPG
jgi:negative regulator of flagellin synthesis FlgM